LKVVLSLETSRRENNKKVEALKEKMLDMMDVLTRCVGLIPNSTAFYQWVRLKDIRKPKREGKTIRMQNLMGDTGKDIEKCGNVCSAYSQEKLLGM
jgi:hypothetical protein